MLWITVTLTKNQYSRGSRIRLDRGALGSDGVAGLAAACDAAPRPTLTLSAASLRSPLDHSGSHAAVPSVKSSGSPCELIGSATKIEKSSVNVMFATKPLFSFAGPLPEFEK